MNKTPAKILKFVDFYLQTGKVGESYEKSHGNKSPANATRLLKSPLVQQEISNRKAAISRAVDFGVQEVMREFLEIARADPNELIQHRRVNCRYCNGKKFAFRWTDQDEYAEACAAVIDANARERNKRKHKPLPDESGGYGFRRIDDPNPACPRCCGEGIPEVYIADTRYLSPSARKLYAGVEVKANGGIKILMRDQDAALRDFAKALGMFIERVQLETNGPTNHKHVHVHMTQQEAARAYADFMKL